MPIVSRVAVNQMLASLLQDGLVDSGITLVLPAEPPPSHRADDDNDNPPQRWCKMHPLILESEANTPATADSRGLSMLLSVQVSESQMRTDPLRLDRDLQTIVETLNHATANHSDGKHSLQLAGVDSDIEDDADHEGNAEGVITITGNARRTL